MADSTATVFAQVETMPKEFWYGLTVILVGILVWIIQKYFMSLQTVINEFRENINELKLISKELLTITKSHEEELKEHKEDIKNLYRGKSSR